MNKCEECLGSGIAYISQGSWDPDVEAITCPDCDGSGITQPAVSKTSNQLLAELQRSLAAAENLNPAFRLGVALAAGKNKEEAA